MRQAREGEGMMNVIDNGMRWVALMQKRDGLLTSIGPFGSRDAVEKYLATWADAVAEKHVNATPVEVPLHIVQRWFAVRFPDAPPTEARCFCAECQAKEKAA